jgi:hypothetical protein
MHLVMGGRKKDTGDDREVQILWFGYRSRNRKEELGKLEGIISCSRESFSEFHRAPKCCNAIRNSFTAVSTSSKFSAESAHLPCFTALMIASSSLTYVSGPDGAGAYCGVGIGAATGGGV